MTSTKLALVADIAVPPAAADIAAVSAGLWRRIIARRGQMLRIGLGASLLAAGAAIYAPDILYTTSSEAVINARIVTIAAPIGGRVADSPPAEGTSVSAGTPLLRIDNPVVDRSRLGELEADRTRTTADLAAADQMAQSLQQQLVLLDDQAAAYRAAAVDRLDFTAREAQAVLVAAQAGATEAERMLARKQALTAAGVDSAADLDVAQKHAATAAADRARAELVAQRLAGSRDAAQRGIFIDDGTNGTPYAQQRADEFRLRLAEARSQADQAQARLGQLNTEIAAEQTRAAHLESAELKAPVAGVIWRPDVTTGSTVGQDSKLMTLIDCSSLFVSGSFSSRQFDNLHPGAAATVRVADSDAEYPGTVVDVRAMRGAENDDHFAAPLPALGAHQVMALVRLDDPGAMAADKYCSVGRHVEIRFKDLAATKAAATPAATQIAAR
jgi:multidrug resistance efflux pump